MSIIRAKRRSPIRLDQSATSSESDASFEPTRTTPLSHVSAPKVLCLGEFTIWLWITGPLTMTTKPDGPPNSHLNYHK